MPDPLHRPAGGLHSDREVAIAVGAGEGVTTAARIAVTRRRLDAVGLDHGIGQQLLAHRLDLGLGRGPVAAVEIELDQLGPADGADPVKAEAAQRPLDRLRLGSSTPWLNETWTLAFIGAGPSACRAHAVIGTASPGP